MWLDSATLGLALSERGRIQDEISAHVSDATAHQIAQGLSELDAEARAIQDLGDPRAARAAFQRTCYTVSDERRLEKLLGRSWWTLPFGFILIPFAFQADTNWWRWQSVAVTALALILPAILCSEPKIKRWLFERFSRNGVIAVQAFSITIAAATICYTAFQESFMFAQPVSIGALSVPVGTWIIALVLSCLWIAQQAPLTFKAIRRTRAYRALQNPTRAGHASPRA